MSVQKKGWKLIEGTSYLEVKSMAYTRTHSFVDHIFDKFALFNPNSHEMVNLAHCSTGAVPTEKINIHDLVFSPGLRGTQKVHNPFFLAI